LSGLTAPLKLCHESYGHRGYILCNLPNGSDIDEDIKEFGIHVVDQLANKLSDEAHRLKAMIETRQLSLEDERKALRQFLGHALNLQRMRRTSVVKELLGIRVLQ
jgi:hypothetical protein